MRPFSIPGLLTALVAANASAQARSAFVGFDLAYVVHGGDGVARSCLESGYNAGVGASVGTAIRTRFTIEFTARAFVFPRPSTCVDGFPPPDGTFVTDDRVNLLGARFLTTDLRFRGRTGTRPGALIVTIGGGVAWHPGHDLPYVVVGAGLSLVDRARLNVTLEGEYQSLRVTSDRFRRTYQNSQLIAEQSLGQIHRWSSASAVGVRFAVSL